MMRVTRQSIGIGMALCAAMAGTSLAASRALSVPVRVSIADMQAEYPLRVQSDRLGEYVPSQQIQSTIEQYRTGFTDWLFATYTLTPKSIIPSNRTVFFDLGEPVSSTNPPAPMSEAFLQAHLKAGCTEANVNLLTMTAGATVRCPGSFRFQALDKRWFRLGMNPNNFPDVDPLQITCASAGSSGCLSWRLVPSGTVTTGIDPNPKNVAKLLRIDAAGNVLEQLGNYYVSFAIDLRR